MRSVRTTAQQFRKRRPPAPKVNASVLYTGKRPLQYRGAYTGLLYVWPTSRPATWGVWMDGRDIPALIKQAGIDNLAGKHIDELREKMAALAEKKAAKKKSKAKQKPEVEDVRQEEAPNEL